MVDQHFANDAGSESHEMRFFVDLDRGVDQAKISLVDQGCGLQGARVAFSAQGSAGPLAEAFIERR
jgi:hypothetical protein